MTEDFIRHVKKLLKRYKMIKVKALRTAVREEDLEDLVKQLSEATNAHVLDLRGRTFVLSTKSEP